MSSEDESARSLTLRLFARAAETSAVRADDVIAVHEACEAACVALSRSLGATGFSVLLTRALGQAVSAYPFLKDVRIRPQPEPSLGGIADLVEGHGAAAVSAALAHLLERVLMLLARLIGADVVCRLVEPRTPNSTQTAGDVT